MTFHPRTRELLTKAGLRERELEALDLPRRHEVPWRPGGFGLVGPNGVGKSLAVARCLAERVEGLVRAQPNPARAVLQVIDGDLVRDYRVLWVNWPDQAERIHERRFEGEQLDAWAEWASDVALLVMDDLGIERFSGDKDPARPLLVRVLDARYRRRLPVIWTSNIIREEVFREFYGPALTSRVLGTWPPGYIGGEDLRLSPVDLKTAAGGER